MLYSAQKNSYGEPIRPGAALKAVNRFSLPVPPGSSGLWVFDISHENSVFVITKEKVGSVAADESAGGARGQVPTDQILSANMVL